MSVRVSSGASAGGNRSCQDEAAGPPSGVSAAGDHEGLSSSEVVPNDGDS